MRVGDLSPKVNIILIYPRYLSSYTAASLDFLGITFRLDRSPSCCSHLWRCQFRSVSVMWGKYMRQDARVRKISVMFICRNSKVSVIIPDRVKTQVGSIKWFWIIHNYTQKHGQGSKHERITRNMETGIEHNEWTKVCKEIKKHEGILKETKSRGELRTPGHNEQIYWTLGQYPLGSIH